MSPASESPAPLRSMLPVAVAAIALLGMAVLGGSSAGLRSQHQLRGALFHAAAAVSASTRAQLRTTTRSLAEAQAHTVALSNQQRRLDGFVGANVALVSVEPSLVDLFDQNREALAGWLERTPPFAGWTPERRQEFATANPDALGRRLEYIAWELRPAAAGAVLGEPSRARTREVLRALGHDREDQSLAEVTAELLAAAEKAPEDAKLRYAAGRVLLHQDRVDEAIEHLAAAARIAPAQPEHQSVLADACLRRAMDAERLASGDPAGWVRDYAEASKHYEAAGDAYLDGAVLREHRLGHAYERWAAAASFAPAEARLASNEKALKLQAGVAKRPDAEVDAVRRARARVAEARAWRNRCVIARCQVDVGPKSDARLTDLERALQGLAEVMAACPANGCEWRLEALAERAETHRRLLQFYANRQKAGEAKRFAKAAVADYDALIAARPDAAALADRAYVYDRTLDYGRALADLLRAVALDPRHTVALNRLAWLRATCPTDAAACNAVRDWAQALFYGTLSCGLWETPTCLDNLAAAWALRGHDQREAAGALADDAEKEKARATASGYFAVAVSLQERAARGSDRARYDKRLAAYRDEKVWNKPVVRFAVEWGQ